jgi:undecaprenyl-diphosphatase
MTLIQSIFLGAMQGVAEFLPISSSGHLVVFRNYMNIGEISPLFDILLHVATLLVVIIVFRKIIVDLLKSLFRYITRKSDESDKLNLRLILVILLASVFTAVLGVLIQEFDVSHKPRLVSVLFLFTAAVLLITRFIKVSDSGYEKVGVKAAVITGIAQGIAVLPGVSRSGMTIASSLYSGIGKDKAGEYSFLLSIPAILGALILELKDFQQLSSEIDLLTISAGMVTAFIVGLVSVLFLLKLIKGNRLYFFSFYLIPFGIISFFLL